jgi:hypothetical protein
VVGVLHAPRTAVQAGAMPRRPRRRRVLRLVVVVAVRLVAVVAAAVVGLVRWRGTAALQCG